MRILVIGGTKFLGRHFVEAALENHHEVTIFHRGQTNTGLFPHVEEILGDRDGQTSLLTARTWDAVVDTCGYVPRVVKQSVETLKALAKQYTFISSISVYPGFPKSGMDESSTVDVLPEEDADSEDISKYYGPLKALCEQEVTQAFGSHALIIRPGLIVGPNDPTDRFTYWPHRMAEGGEVLVPGDFSRPVQFIDVRDLARFTLHLIEQEASGIYHATGHPLPFSQLLDVCQAVSERDATLVSVDETFLAQQGVQPWIELPLWIGEAAGWPGFMEVSVEKATTHGLQLRPLVETVRDTLAWSDNRPSDTEWKAGMKPDRERELLATWNSVRATYQNP